MAGCDDTARWEFNQEKAYSTYATGRKMWGQVRVAWEQLKGLFTPQAYRRTGSILRGRVAATKHHEGKIGYRGQKSEESSVFIGKMNAPLLERLNSGPEA